MRNFSMENLKRHIPIRSYSGEAWITNISNKKRLVIDFNCKCAYCDDHHYSGGFNSFHVDHFAPKARFKHLAFTYENLLYCCPYCNASKSNKWEGNDETENIIGNKGFVDPCSSEYSKHLGRKKSGNIIYLTEIGEYMYFELKLYLKRHMLIYKLEKLKERRIKLKEKISELNQSGADTTKLKEFYKLLCVEFCEYYDLYFEEVESMTPN